MDSGVGSIIGSGISAVANLYANDLAWKREKEMNQRKYRDMMNFAHQAGATPSAIVQGITGSAGGSVPTISTSNNPVPDLGSSYSAGVQADAAQKQAVAAQNQAQAAMTNAETDRQLGLMRLKFEPKKYVADIKLSLQRAFEANKNAFLHGSMRKYYDELVTDIQQIRPWKIAGLRQGLLNDIATYSNIVQDTKLKQAQTKREYSAANELETRSTLNKAEAKLTYYKTLSESLGQFRTQWENTLLKFGIDPNKGFWENSARLMYTNPELFKQRLDMFVTALNTLDGRLQDNLGEHYKRNIVAGYGLYKLNDIYQKNANNRAYRFGVLGNTISSFIPFTNGSTPAPIGYKRY